MNPIDALSDEAAARLFSAVESHFDPDEVMVILDEWDLVYERFPHRWGLCRNSLRVVFIHPMLYQRVQLAESHDRELLHQILHILAGSDSHKDRWLTWAERAGIPTTDCNRGEPK